MKKDGTRERKNKGRISECSEARRSKWLGNTHCLSESWLRRKLHCSHWCLYHWWLQLGTGSGSWAAICTRQLKLPCTPTMSISHQTSFGCNVHINRNFAEHAYPSSFKSNVSRQVTFPELPFTLKWNWTINLSWKQHSFLTLTVSAKLWEKHPTKTY